MSKKTFMSTIVIAAFLISLVAGIQVVKVAKANPITFPPFPPEPNRDPAILSVESPANKTYYERDIPLSFIVTQPNSWLNQTYVDITNVKYTLDKQTISMWNTSGPREPDILPSSYTFSTILRDLEDGEHTIDVEADSESYYSGFSPMDHQTVTNQVIVLRVEVDPPTLSPTPSPTHTESPTQHTTVTTYQTDNLVDYGTYHTDPFPYLLGICAIVLVAVSVGVLFYLKKRKG